MSYGLEALIFQGVFLGQNFSGKNEEILIYSPPITIFPVNRQWSCKATASLKHLKMLERFYRKQTASVMRSVL